MTVSAPRTNPVSRLNNPARTYRSRRFADALAGAHAKLTAVADRYSFDVGLSHSHLYDGLSRRTTARGHRGSLNLRRRAFSSPSPGRFHPGAFGCKNSDSRSRIRPFTGRTELSHPQPPLASGDRSWTIILVMPETLPLSLVKARLSELVDRVEGEDERIVVTRNGRAVAVLISADDLESLEETLAVLSDRELMRRVREGERAAERGDVVPLDELKGRHSRGG